MQLARRPGDSGRSERTPSLGHLCEGVIEAGWLVTLATAPLVVNVHSQRSFDPDKAALVSMLALVMVAAWLVRSAGGGRAALGLADDDAAGAWRWSVFAPVCLIGLSLLVSSLMSIDPRLSWNGSYSRAQGTWTQLAYLTIFAIMLAHLRRAAQVRRLVFVVVLTSLPAALYGLFQHLGQDPVQWLLPHDRAGSTLGNPVFFAAYLGMTLFLTLDALWRQRSTVARAGALLYVVLMQLTALAVAQSRGPILGLLAGFVVVVILIPTLRRKTGSHEGRPAPHQAPRTARRRATYAIGVLVLMTLGIAGSSSSRLADLLDPTSPTARVRILIWQGAVNIVTAPPLVSANSEVDRWHRWRPWIGHGPETFALAFHRFHSPELARLERPDSTPDRAHNILLDLLVTVGVFGLVAWLWLIGGLCFLALKSLRRPMDSAEPSSSRSQNQLTVALLATLVAHVVELQFSFLVTATTLYFWALAALLVANCQGWLGWGSSAGERQPPEDDASPNLREGSIAGLLTAAVAGPLIYLALASGSDSNFAKTLSEQATRGAGPLLLVLLLTVIVAAALAPTTQTPTINKTPTNTAIQPTQRAWWTGFAFASIAPLAIYAIAHSLRLRHVSQALDAGHELTRISHDVASTFPTFAVWLLAVVLAAGVSLSLGQHASACQRPPKRSAYRPTLIALVIGTITVTVVWLASGPLPSMLLRPIRADTLLKHGESFRAAGRPDLALELLNDAVLLAPNEPRMLQARAGAKLSRAQSKNLPTRVETTQSLLAQATVDLERALELAPLDPEHSANLARLLIAKSELDDDISARDLAYRRAASAYREALRLRPRSVVLLGESAALAHRRGQSQQARELLQQALELDPAALQAFRRTQLSRRLMLPSPSKPSQP